MDTGDDPNAANLTLDPHRRNRGDDGADPNAAAGHPPGEPTRERPSRDELMSRPRRLLLLDGLFPLGWMPVEPSAARSQASSSAAPPSDHPGAERTESGTRVRQSVLYSDRPRRSRRRRPTEHVEQHLSEVSSTELEVTDLPTFEAQSASGSAGFLPDHPGAEGAVSGTRIRQSVLYSNRPRRPRRRQVPLLTEEHPCEVSSSELGGTATDLPTLEALSLSDPPLLTPQIVDESDYDDDDDVDALHEPIAFGRIGSFGPQTLHYLEPRPTFKWSEGALERGQTPFEEIAAARSAMLGPSRSEALSGSDSSFSPKSIEKNPTKDSDDNTEELLRLIREHRAAHTYTSLRQGFDATLAAHHAYRTELAAKTGTEPSPPLPAKQTQSLQARQQSSSAAAQPQHSTAPRKPRCEASNAELAENAEIWMREEVKMVFEKYIERRDDLKGLEWCFNELCHQCFNVENYNKIFHHYNFTVRMKKPNSVDWVVALYFAEVKQMFGRKYYFCCRLEPNENGHCYACKSQGVEDLQHPATGGFDRGLPNVGLAFWYE